MDDNDLHNRTSAGFLRRLMASLYDWLLVIALMMVLSVPAVALLNDSITPGNAAYRVAMCLVATLFFVGFWTRGGQTLGMRAWRLQLTLADGSAVPASKAMLRFLYAFVSLVPAGLGFIWILWDTDSMSWHDRLSGTRIQLLPKRQALKNLSSR